MSNLNLRDVPLDFSPRRLLKIRARAGSEAVVVEARSDDGPMGHDLWVVQTAQYSALLNVDLERLPPTITFSLRPAAGGAFPVGAHPQVTVQVGTDNVTISAPGVGGLSSVDVFKVDVRDDGMTMRRAVSLIPPPCSVPEPGGSVGGVVSAVAGSAQSEAAAAAARSVVKSQLLDPARQRRIVVTVDGSGSMKEPAALDALDGLIDVLCGVAQVFSPVAPPVLELSTGRDCVAAADTAGLVAALKEAPFTVGAPWAQPSHSSVDGTAYLVISDEVPYQLSTWTLGGQDTLQVIILGDAAPHREPALLTAHYRETASTTDFVHDVLRSFPERNPRFEGTHS